jgi:hypothetical protein
MSIRLDGSLTFSAISSPAPGATSSYALSRDSAVPMLQRLLLSRMSHSLSAKVLQLQRMVAHTWTTLAQPL